MANNTIQEITKTIDEFSAEIHKFQSLIEYLDNAKVAISNAKDAQKRSIDILDQKAQFLVESYQKFEKLVSNADHIGNLLGKVDFPLRLDKIEETVKSTISIINKNQAHAVAELETARNDLKDVDLNALANGVKLSIEKSIAENKKIWEKIANFNIDKELNGFERKISNKLDTELRNLKNDVVSNNSLLESLFISVADLESLVNKSLKEQLEVQKNNNKLILEEISAVKKDNEALILKINEISKHQKSYQQITLILLIVSVVVGALVLIIK